MEITKEMKHHNWNQYRVMGGQEDQEKDSPENLTHLIEVGKKKQKQLPKQ